MRRPAPLLLALLAAAPSAADAQDPSVPADLFYAVAGVEDASSVAVGDAPARLAALFPDGADVLGTLGGPARADGRAHGTAIGRVGRDPTEVVTFYDATPPAGWRPHVYWVTDGEGGFAPSAPRGGRVVLCPTDPADSGGPVSVEVSKRPGGGAYVTVREGGWYRVQCDGALTTPPFRFSSESVPEVELSDLPLLTPPLGGRHEVSGGGGSTDYQSQEASLTWAGTAPDALLHYAEQLESAGWLPLGAGGEGGAAAGTWLRATEDEPTTVTLAVVRSEPGQYALRLTLAAYGF